LLENLRLLRHDSSLHPIRRIPEIGMVTGVGMTGMGPVWFTILWESGKTLAPAFTARRGQSYVLLFSLVFDKYV
jgi:hypothetical protein